MKLRSEEKADAAAVVKDVSFDSPTKAKKYRKSLELADKCQQFTSDETSSLFLGLI